MIKTIIAAYSIILTLCVSSLIGLASSSNATQTVNPAGETFIIGPGSTETFFFIVDKSRGPAVRWTCGFIHNFTPNKFGGFTPEVSCNS